MLTIEHTLASILQQHLNINLPEVHAVSGGSINDAFQVIINGKNLFCKVNSATKFPHLFEKEAEGLLLLKKQVIFRTPEVIDIIEVNAYQVLLMEWIQSASPTSSFWKVFGEKLARLHQVSQEFYGLDSYNYMGAVKQQNTPTYIWSTFFIEQRLQPLVQQCFDKQLLTGKHSGQFEKLYTRVPGIFNDEPAALLHGDLWSGNFMCSTHQEPVLIDPAVYFGHRSIDLGMTTLFGGFTPAFFDAYHHHYPLPTNHKVQWKVANLYPLLIHLLLFGKTYLSSIERTLNDFQ